MTIRFDEQAPGADEAELLDQHDVLAFTEELFRQALSDLGEALGAIRAGRLEAAKSGRQAVRDLSAMGVQLLEERRNVERLRRKISGEVGAGELDLVAAHDEIGRRLACLRGA